MTTLIILCAGSATLDGKRSCIAVHPDGKYLFEKCISGINLTGINRIVISVFENDNLEFEIEKKVRESFKELSFNGQIEVCAIPFKTNDSSETVYCTIKQMKISGRILIKDVDNFFIVEDINYENFVAGLDILDYDIRRLHRKSFITINEQNYILDIIEKRVKSGIICTGFYGFKSAKDFVKVYDTLKDEMYNIEKIYVSHIVAYMIGRFGGIFKYVQVNNFESYDSQEDWNDLINHFEKSQSPKEKLILLDLDGTLFDTNEVNYYAYKEALENFGYKFEHEYWYNNCIGRHYKDFLADLNITDEKILQEVHHLKKQCYKKYLHYAKENRPLFEIIESIKPNNYIALVTTASRKNVEDIVNAFGKTDIFDKIFTQEDVINLKPNPECYLKAMRYFNVTPENTIIFEDSDAGLKAADLSGAFYYKVFRFNNEN